MRLAGRIEILGEGEAGFGLRFGRVDIEAGESELTTVGADARVHCARNRLEAAGDPREEAAASAFAFTQEIETAHHNDEDGRDGAPNQDNPPNHFPLPERSKSAVPDSLTVCSANGNEGIFGRDGGNTVTHLRGERIYCALFSPNVGGA
jgi:hypothetical protein